MVKLVKNDGEVLFFNFFQFRVRLVRCLYFAYLRHRFT